MVFALPRNENSLAVNSKRAVIIHPQHQTALRRFPRAERINDNPQSQLPLNAPASLLNGTGTPPDAVRELSGREFA